jgi:nucleoid-associated protein YgaU
MKMHGFRVACLLGISVLLAGCGRHSVARRDARERNNRLVAQAYQKIEAGSFGEAAILLREALDTFPTMARPHLDLAIILHEREQDYMRALYHYQRYLELRPGTEKDVMIRARMVQARDAFVAGYAGTQAAEVAVVPVDVAPAPLPVDQPVEPDAGMMQMEQHLASASQQLAALTQQVAEQRLQAAEREKQLEQRQRDLVQAQRERDALRVTFAEQEQVLMVRQTRIEQLEAQVRVLEDQELRRGAVPARPLPQPVTSSPEPQIPVIATPREVPVVEPGVAPRTYVVRPNDSLTGIAQRVYGDATRWRVIRDANRDVLGDSETLRVGQTLVIPDITLRDRR